MRPTNVVRIGEPFLLLCELKNETPYSLKFRNSSLELNSDINYKTNLDGQQDQIESFLANGLLLFSIIPE